MNWYSGNITEAVALSKSKNAIFVVYIEGKDELSQKLTNFINDEKIKSKLETDRFVAIKIEGGSTAYMQFAQIYQLVPLPSLFFIGKNGTPLEVATGVISSVDELNGKIENVLKLAGFSNEQDKKDSNQSLSTPSTSSNTPSTSLATASADFISNEQKTTVDKTVNANSTSSNIVCDGDICYKKVEQKEDKEFNEKSETEKAEKPKTDENVDKEKIEQESVHLSTTSQPSPVEEKNESKVPVQPLTTSQSQSSSPIEEKTAEDKVEHAKKRLEELKKEHEAEQARLDREREIRRRKEGQEMLNAKKKQHELELQQLKEKIQKEKLEEQTARQRILEQIAADRAERAQKMNLSQPQPQPSKPTNETSSNQRQVPKTESGSEFVRIQFRKQNGESETHNFQSNDQFKVVREFVKVTLLDGKFKEFSLATTFPRREFIESDDTSTLKELDLYPSAVLLVITPTITGPAAVVARSGGFVNIFNTVFWGILSPIFIILNYFKGFITGRRPTNSSGSGVSQKRTNTDSVANDVSKKRNIDRLQNKEIIDDGPSTGINTTNKSLPYRRIGNSNIHRLNDQKDSDDENNTWNGNSTQQQ